MPSRSPAASRHLALFRLVTVTLALALASTATVALASAASHAMMGRTQVGHFAPFLSSGKIAAGYAVVKSTYGYCWTTSDATPRKDAYRCMHGNELFDPCFRNPRGTEVACAVGVSPPKVDVLALTRKLPAPSGMRATQAFALVLAGGATCWFDTGATFVWKGRRANFGCPNRLWLFGHVDRTHEPWTIEAGKGLHPHPKWVKVAQAWF